MYQNLPLSKFSMGWLEMFKQKYYMKHQMRYDKVNLIDAATIAEELKKL